MKNYYDVQPALNYGYLSPDPSKPWEQSYDAPGRGWSDRNSRTS